MKRLLVLALVAGALACSPDEQPAATPAAVSEAPSATATPGGLSGASCDRQQGGSDDAAMLLRAVRVAGQPGFDRVTFEFEPAAGQQPEVPHYDVKQAAPPLTEDGSGKEIEVEGSSFLSATIFASGVDLTGDEPRIVYSGPKSIRPADTSVVKEVRNAGDFENVLTWYVGLTRGHCFKVSTLTNPVRVVVDIAAS